MKKYTGNNWKLYQGSMLDMAEVIQPNSIDSIVTDPPYELNFMGKGWDNSGIAFKADTWKRCFDTLKPGGYLLAFGGSRTFHRIAVAIEDAGFEIRDVIMWLYGSGFPKSMDLSKSIDNHFGVKGEKIGEKTFGKTSTGQNSGWNNNNVAQTGKQDVFAPATDLAKQWSGWGTALKPSYEPIIIARKPCEGSCTDNVLKYGVGGINIDECRVGDDLIKSNGGRKNNVSGDTRTGKALGMYGGGIEPLNTEHIGRFPANTILTYDDTDYEEVCGGMPETKSSGGAMTVKKMYGGKYFGSCVERVETGYIAPSDSGSASRYFYCAKASKRDRDEGLGAFIGEKVTDGRKTKIDNAFQRGETIRKNIHPTVKPTSLMQYLVRLVTPKGGTILDPFNGSGSTGKAVMYENKDRDAGYKYIGIELTEEYIPISVARISFVMGDEPEEQEQDQEWEQMTIFDFIKG